MALRRLKKKKREAGVPTDSISDIAFLLIIFFILTTLLERHGFVTDLPAAQKAAQPPEKQPTVSVKGGLLFFNQDNLGDVEFAIPDLAVRLNGLKLLEKAEDQRLVVFEPADEMRYQEYYSIMAAITDAHGVVGIMTEEKGPG